MFVYLDRIARGFVALHLINSRTGLLYVERCGRMPDSPSCDPGSNPSLLPFRKLGIFVLSTDAPVDSTV